MGNKLVSNEELIVSNMLEIQSIIRILKRKGISSEDEILKEEMNKMVKRMSEEN